MPIKETIKWLKALEREMKEETSRANRYPDPEYRDEVYIAINTAISHLQKQSKDREFVEWVAELIFEEGWELNMPAFPERACRRLEKLGDVVRMGDEWILVNSFGEVKPNECKKGGADKE